ncbi:EF-hand domain-containing protein [Ulvibacter antarcticus]|uniref:EF hand domain-containing protein n=1 Tax=Ulvibacter antarcticus TaxID=442714 RepID=A0A3L9YW71_9FLAO|nr:EF-hand domain-containing protein [Ulvibacter antarcticus]RMA64763.1 EF hand domain-containing protein [Ulvibacter antarcticus]
MKNINLKTVTMTLGFLCFGIAFTNAQPSGERSQKAPSFSELVEKMDSNKDGKLSEDELKGPLKENFAKVDTDEDGFISEEEFNKAPKLKGREKRQKS